MQFPEKENQGNSPNDDSTSSKDSPTYNPKKKLRTRYERALTYEETSSSSNVSPLGANQLEREATAALQERLQPNSPAPTPSPTPSKHVVEDSDNKTHANKFSRGLESPLIKSELSGEDEEQDYYWTGYSAETQPHLGQFSLLPPPPPPPESAEAPEGQPRFYVNTPSPAPPLPGTPAVDIVRAQPVTRTPSQNPEWSEIDMLRIVKTAEGTIIGILKQERDENEMFQDYNQSEELTSAAPLIMCRDFVRGHCRLGAACNFEHQIILSQLPGIYIFCKDFQHSECSKTCQSVHATVFEEEHFLRTGYLPLHTRAHLPEFTLLLPPPPPPPPPQTEETSTNQSTVSCNSPSSPPSPTSCMAVDNAEANREQSEPDIARQQPGTSSSLNPERSEADILNKYTSEHVLRNLQPTDEKMSVSSESGELKVKTEFNQEELSAIPVPTTSPLEAQASATEYVMCKHYVRGTCENGQACKYKHEIILSQLREVYEFCTEFQDTSVCSNPCCQFVHSSMFEREHFLRTGYLPPHTLAHLEQPSVLASTSPALQFEEASAEQSTVSSNAPSSPPSPMSCTSAVDNAETTGEQSEPENVTAQPSTSTSAPNPERSEDTLRIVTSPAPLPPLTNPPPSNETKSSPTKSLAEDNQQDGKKTAASATQTDMTVFQPGQSKDEPAVMMCRNFARGSCTRVACKYAHQLILSQLPGVYTFCRNFQNATCVLTNCKFVHATVFEKERFYRTGYLPPYALAHIPPRTLKALSPPPGLQSQEASAAQPTVYCNVAEPPPRIPFPPPAAVGYNAATAGRHVADTFRVQPGPSTSAQNSERSDINAEASAAQPTVYCNVAEPPPRIPFPPPAAVGYNAATAGRHVADTFRVQPGPSTSAQNAERSDINAGASAAQPTVYCNVAEPPPRIPFPPPAALGYNAATAGRHVADTFRVQPGPSTSAQNAERSDINAEASSAQPTVYCNVAEPPPRITFPPPAAVGYNAATAGRHVADTFRVQPGPSTSAQNAERSDINAASSSTRDCDSARRHNESLIREQREIAKQKAETRRRIKEKKELNARIRWECEMMDLLVSSFNTIVQQNSQDAERENRGKDRP